MAEQSLPAQVVPPLSAYKLTVEPGDGGERREIGRDRACAARIEVEHPEILERGARTLVYAHIRMVKRSKSKVVGL